LSERTRYSENLCREHIRLERADMPRRLQHCQYLRSISGAKAQRAKARYRGNKHAMRISACAAPTSVTATGTATATLSVAPTPQTRFYDFYGLRRLNGEFLGRDASSGYPFAGSLRKCFCLAFRRAFQPLTKEDVRGKTLLLAFGACGRHAALHRMAFQSCFDTCHLLMRGR